MRKKPHKACDLACVGRKECNLDCQNAYREPICASDTQSYEVFVCATCNLWCLVNVSLTTPHVQPLEWDEKHPAAALWRKFWDELGLN